MFSLSRVMSRVASSAMAGTSAAAAASSSSTATAVRTAGIRSASTWQEKVPMGPVDAIFGLTIAFNNDDNPNKVNVGVGAYRDDSGKPWVLPSVREAERRLVEAQVNHEYAGIGGIDNYVDLSIKFCLGEDNEAIKEKRIGGIQTISGTGALRTAGDLIAKFVGKGTPIYIPNPTWGNHRAIFSDAGLTVKEYTYYDPATIRLDFAGLMSDVKNMEDDSVLLLHACAHNPTGIDLTQEQWKELSALVTKRNLRVIFDTAYQGFATGDARQDSFAVRQFIADGVNPIVCQSYSKNFGLYGERTGCCFVVCENEEAAEAVKSQLKIIVRAIYSNPPIYGARLVEQVLGDQTLNAQWYTECKSMADRIISMRAALRGNLEGLGSAHDWSHVTEQIGMFCYSGLTAEQVGQMRDRHSIYMTNDGRISIAGVCSGNVDYLANAIHDVTK